MMAAGPASTHAGDSCGAILAFVKAAHADGGRELTISYHDLSVGCGPSDDRIGRAFCEGAVLGGSHEFPESLPARLGECLKIGGYKVRRETDAGYSGMVEEQGGAARKRTIRLSAHKRGGARVELVFRPEKPGPTDTDGQFTLTVD
jgi:hypothetical protein